MEKSTKKRHKKWLNLTEDDLAFVRIDVFQNAPGSIAIWVHESGKTLRLGGGSKSLSCIIHPAQHYSEEEISRFLPVGASDINRNWPTLKSLVKYKDYSLAYELRGEVLAVVTKNPDYRHEVTEEYISSWQLRNPIDQKGRGSASLDEIRDLMLSLNSVFMALPERLEASIEKKISAV